MSKPNCSNNFEGNEIILYASIFSMIISQGLNLNELNILGNFFQALGQNMEVLAAYLSACSSNSAQSSNSNTNTNFPNITG